LRLLNKYSKNIFTSLEAQWQCNEDILHLKAMMGAAPLDVELKFVQDNGLKMLVNSLSVVKIPLKSITDLANYTSKPFDLVALLSGESKGKQERSRFKKMINTVMTPIYDAVAATGGAVTSGVAAAGDMYQKIRDVLDAPVRAQLEQMVEEASDEGFSPGLR